MSEAELLDLDEQSADPETETEQGSESTLTLARANDMLPGQIHLLPVASRPFFPGQAVHPHFVEVDELVEKPVPPKLLLEKVAALLKTVETRKAAGK